VNRSVHGLYNPWPETPHFERIFIRDISDLSYNNGVGLGMADVVHDRLVNKIDWNPTQINSLTASTPAAIRTPLHFPSDRTCIEKMMPTVGKFSSTDVTIGWIRNSMELGLIGLTENLRPLIEQNPALEILGPAKEWEFDAEGNMGRLPISTLEFQAAH
jgi:hypothetical protein